MIFKPTLEQQEFIDNHSDEIIKLAEEFWNSANKVNYDPTHPNWNHFDDPIKDKYIEVATYITCVNQFDDL